MKKGFIAISFLVGIIIALLLLSALFVYFFNTKEKIQAGYEDIEGANRQEFENLLASGTAKVVFPYAQYELKQGGSNTFPIGIRNIFDVKANYVIRVEPDWSLELKFNLNPGKHEIFQFPIKVPDNTNKGLHKLKIIVECDVYGKLCDPYYSTMLDLIVD